ncbi:hypothetical protein [Chondromyces crocatus]|uniref:Uncharacterized protein n=1 Tax=Chondromyces crocatus TaxID=52 RepID=A0A0K1E8N2_CHOCO|nr:hypothetical protein [Chondromyces crocatus]AKT37215.1 uncharacterized protein CMC5_013460 [Chondromyces crocatus]
MGKRASTHQEGAAETDSQRSDQGAPAQPTSPPVRPLRLVGSTPEEVAPARFMWGETGPFEGFVPGLATAGALAAELDRVLRGRAARLSRTASAAERARWLEDALNPTVAACRVGLVPAARAAFDAATLILAELHAPSAVPQRALRLCRLWTATPPALREIATICELLGASEAVDVAMRVLRTPLPPASMVIEAFDQRLAPEFSLMDALLTTAAMGPGSTTP